MDVGRVHGGCRGSRDDSCGDGRVHRATIDVEVTVGEGHIGTIEGPDTFPASVVFVTYRVLETDGVVCECGIFPINSPSNPSGIFNKPAVVESLHNDV